MTACEHPDVAASSAYSYGCRCRRCREAHNEYQREYHHRTRVAATPVTLAEGLWARRPPPGEWVRDAACRLYPLDWWFPAEGDSQAAYRRARQVCAVCPVRAECLAHAVTSAEQYGMWGGKTPKDRRRLRTGRLAS